MKVTAPGKLMLSGEWSVLEDGVPCVVMAIDQKVSVDINSNSNIILSAKGTEFKSSAKFENNTLILDSDDKSKEFFLFVAKSVEASLKYLNESGVQTQNFSIETNSSDTVVELPSGQKAKVGFGSSAAIVAATVAAVLAFHKQDISSVKAKQNIFKLGCIAHFLAQGKIGSSFDVAASTFGGTLVYQKPDMSWVTTQLAFGKKISEVVNANWPLLITEPIELPKNFNLSIGFVGNSASTKELILKLNTFKAEKKNDYDKIIASIKTITQKLINAIKENNQSEILDLLNTNRLELKLLSDSSQNNLETKELALLADLAKLNGGAGKFSGAGGGDCGIAVSFDSDTKEKIENDWKQNNITPINANISKDGVLNV